MFQKFNTDTLMSRFIKQLLATTWIPLLDYIQEGDIMIAGCQYIYKDRILECTSTGVFIVSNWGVLHPRNNLYPADDLWVGIDFLKDADASAKEKLNMYQELEEVLNGRSIAGFKIVSTTHESSQHICNYKYSSPVHWYDTLTHVHLGNYLRYLRDEKQIDLMPYYNCYSGYEIRGVMLNPLEEDVIHPEEALFPSNDIYPGMYMYTYPNIKYSLRNSDDYRIVAVPIKFNRTYTVAIESSCTFYTGAVICNEFGMLRKSRGRFKYYTDMLGDHIWSVRAPSQFKRPFTIRVNTEYKSSDYNAITLTDAEQKELYDRQDCLYFIIQLPKSNQSPIVVLEGEYGMEGSPIQSAEGSSKISSTKPSLLSQELFATNNSYAFSSRLVEYLLQNVIDYSTETSGSIRAIQDALSTIDNTYASALASRKIIRGAWTKDIKEAVYRLLDTDLKTIHPTKTIEIVKSVDEEGKTVETIQEAQKTNINPYDHDGNVNKDIEYLLYEKGVY